MARRLLQDSISGVSSDEIKYLGPNHIHAVIEELKRNERRAIPTLWASAGQHIWKVISAWSRKIAKGNPEHAGIEQILALRETVRQMRIVLPETNWADYYGESYLDFKSRAHWKSKEISVADILDEVKPKSVLDIGSNRGWFSILAARTGAEVIASDIDEPSLNKLFDDCTNQKIRLLPIFMDIRDPLPAYGLCYEWFPAASTRFKVEMVLGLAVVHHLAPQLGFPPEVDQKRR